MLQKHPTCLFLIFGVDKHICEHMFNIIQSYICFFQYIKQHDIRIWPYLAWCSIPPFRCASLVGSRQTPAAHPDHLPLARPPLPPLLATVLRCVECCYLCCIHSILWAQNCNTQLCSVMFSPIFFCLLRFWSHLVSRISAFEKSQLEALAAAKFLFRCPAPWVAEAIAPATSDGKCHETAVDLPQPDPGSGSWPPRH